MAVTKRNQSFLVLSLILMGLFVCYFWLHENIIKEPKTYLLKDEKIEDLCSNAYLVNTPGCKIPKMDPYDVSVRKHLQRADFPVCDKIPPLIMSDEKSLWVVTDAFKYYDVFDPSRLNCCYSEFKRASSSVHGDLQDPDNQIEISNNCIQLNWTADIPFEFVKAECFVDKVSIYKDFHAFVVPKVKNISKPKRGRVRTTKKESKMSVLIIGADSMSRVNFQRQMPKTKNFMNYLGAIEFFGYNKVHDNTFPNLVPLLSGYAVDEISFCWSNQSVDYFDDCPWIWKNFSAKNYFTAFGEDTCWMGLFNYQKRGFKEPPTDYYIRPFMTFSEDEIGNGKLTNAKICIGNRYTPEVLFDYAYKFIRNMTDSKKDFWGFFWQSSFTHDFLVVPFQADDIFYKFFFKLMDLNLLNKTAVLFLSDHGMRWGGIRETYQGRLEEHLPFLFVILPQWFKKKYSSAVKNLERNTRLLTTHFDLHETMKDFMNLDSLEDNILKSRARESALDRAASLFLPLSVERTCESVRVQPSWCTCQQRKETSIKDTLVQNAAKVTVEFLNVKLRNYKNCAQLSLDKILSAYKEMEDERLQNVAYGKIFISDYVVTFLTQPGGGEFQSVVRHNSETNEMSVIGGVSRINLYGSQSSCVSDIFIKLYCFCI